jgi:hypothetical protein
LSLTPPTPTPTATPSCFIDDCASCGPSYSAYNETTCYSISSIPATPPSNPYTLVPKSYISYSGFGTYVYNPGYTISGYTNSITDGLYTIINTPFLWKNISSSNTSGPLNRCGLWVNGSGQPVNTWVGFSVCLDVLTTKTYYIGIGGDNHFKLTLDGNVIVNTRLAISQWYGLNYPFTRWNVYPITINSGPHILELFGWNNESFASFGCEIYDNTLNELITSSTLSDLNIIFTSSGITSANVIQNSYDEYLDTGFSCPDGYVYNHCTNTCEFFSFCYTCPDPTPTVTPGLSPTTTPTVTPTPTPTPTAFCCLDTNPLPSNGVTVNINGVNVTGQSTGSVVTIGPQLLCPACYDYCINITSMLYAGQDGLNWTYTMTFSQPVNNVQLRILNYTFSADTSGSLVSFESITFGTSNGIPNITTCDACCYIIVGNNLSAFNSSGCGTEFGSGSGIFTITSSGYFTSLTLSAVAAYGAGLQFDLCDFDVII